MSIRLTNVAQFEAELKEFQRRTKIAPKTIAGRLALSTFRGVVQRTPVDTGWARANWELRQGSALPTEPSVPKPSRDNKLAAPRAKLPPAPEFPVYWVLNNVPYIVPLENGHSQQMGKGYMVRRTLVAVREEIRTLLRELRG